MKKVSKNTMIAFILGEYSTYGYNQSMLGIQLSRLLHIPEDRVEQEFNKLGNKKIAYLWLAVFGEQRRIAL